MMTTALTDFARETESHLQALTRAVAEGYRLDKSADPTEGYREDLSAADAAKVAAEDPGLITLHRWTCSGCGEHTSDPTWHDGSPYCEGCEAAPSDPPDAPAYPRAVAREVAARRPDLVVGDSVSAVLTAQPHLTADEAIAVLDEATAEAS